MKSKTCLVCLPNASEFYDVYGLTIFFNFKSDNCVCCEAAFPEVFNKKVFLETFEDSLCNLASWLKTTVACELSKILKGCYLTKHLLTASSKFCHDCLNAMHFLVCFGFNFNPAKTCNHWCFIKSTKDGCKLYHLERERCSKLDNKRNG